MTKKNKNRTRSKNTRRASFPSEETQYPWLRLLMEAYHIVDKGVSRSIATEQKKGRQLACGRGCAHCCRTHQDIPVYPLELVGLSWYVAEKLSGPHRDVIKRHLNAFKRSDPCPFLVEDTCAIHIVRPMACRQFNVFGTPCAPGEDPFHTRREDVMEPVKKYIDQAFFIMLPYHGVEKDSDRVKIVESGGMHKMVKELHACNWKLLVERMERCD